MEMVLINGFCEMSQEEILFVEAGGWLEAGAVFVGTVSLAFSPVVAFVCPPAAGGMALAGLGLIGKGTGAF